MTVSVPDSTRLLVLPIGSRKRVSIKPVNKPNNSPKPLVQYEFGFATTCEQPWRRSRRSRAERVVHIPLTGTADAIREDINFPRGKLNAAKPAPPAGQNGKGVL